MKELLRKIRENNIVLELKDGELKMYSGKVPDERLLAEIKGNKSELISFLKRNDQIKFGDRVKPVIPQAAADISYPLSSSQRRLWVLSQLREGSMAYNLPGFHLLEGKLNREYLNLAFNKLIQRHEILRTVFREDEKGEARQMILPVKEVDFSIQYKDLRLSPVKDVILRTAVQQEIEQLFDLTNGPLLKVNLLQTEDEKYTLTCTIHHIICDGWSMGVIIRDLFTIYNSEAEEGGISLPPLNLQYKDYAVWQQDQLNGGLLSKHKEYWLSRFSGELPVLELPGDNNRPVIKTYNGGMCSLKFPAELYDKLLSDTRQNHSTVFINLLTAINVLFYKYTGQEDMIIGTPVAGREFIQLEEQVGVYINILPLRNHFNGENSIAELLQVIRQNTLEAFEHQVYPFDELVNDLNLKRDTSRSPLFDVMIILNKNADAEEQQPGGLKISPYEDDKKVITKYDLTFNFIETEKTLQLKLEYNSDVFTKETIDLMGAHLGRILHLMTLDPSLKIKDLDYLTAAEKKKLLSFTQTEFAYPSEKTVVDLFTERVKKTPDRVAVVFENETITFKELDQRSDCLADYLSHKGVKRNTLVPVCIEKGIDMLVGLLAILKAGGAYVPLDPEYPADRIAYILGNTEASLILSSEACEAKVRATGAEIIKVEGDWQMIRMEDSYENPQKVLPADLCYMIYTSGSTGRPKGVMITHRNLVNFMFGLDKAVDLSPEDHLLSVTSISFDIAFLELFYTLCRGILVTIKPHNKLLTNLDNFLTSGQVQMDFSLFYFSTQDNATNKNKYELLQQSVRFADAHDFSAVWLPERHFHEFGGIFPNPALLGSALAVTTKKIEIRSGSVVLPLHDPLKIAEEWSIVDNLSGGRVSLSIASGWHADDFVLRPENYRERQRIMYSQIEELKKLWQGDSVKRVNGTQHEIEVKIFPRPVQKELPLWITSTGNTETFRSAGRIGAGILTHLLGQEISELKKNIQVYKETLKENGFPPEKARVALMLHTYVGSDLNTVKAEVKEPFKSYLRSSVSLLKNLAKNTGMDPDGMSESVLNNLLEISFERYWQTSALLGTKESCSRLIAQLSAIGVTEAACLIDFGMGDQEVLAGLNNLNELRKKFQANQLDQQKPVTALQVTPSYLALLEEDENSRIFLRSLKHILIGGETLAGGLINKLSTCTTATLYNMYGPTETTVWSAAKKNVQAEQVTIGKPLSNTKIYILDPSLNLCPVGINGEIYIGGDGVAGGYFKNAELTEERFISDPFSGGPSGRIYKTGDTGRWLPDGEIEFTGRKDDQVKINGYRIELGEIEEALLKHPSIRQAVVIKKQNPSGEKFLVAYVIGEILNTVNLREYLGLNLPQYMIPAFFVELKEMPLTPNGKTDKSALPAHNENNISMAQAYVPPSTENESILAGIWSDILGIKKEKIGIKDSFFDLGGNSLKMIRMLSVVNKMFNKDISLVTVYALPHIAALSEHIQNGGSPATDKVSESMDRLANVMEDTLELLKSS